MNPVLQRTRPDCSDIKQLHALLFSGLDSMHSLSCVCVQACVESEINFLADLPQGVRLKSKLKTSLGEKKQAVLASNLFSVIEI